MSSVTEGGEAKSLSDRWLSEAEALQRRFSMPGLAAKEQLLGMSGMEFFAGMMDGKIPPPHMSVTADFIIVKADFGHIIMQGSPGEKFQNTLGIIHGGWIATILDSAVGCAVHSTLPAGMGYATAELKVSYFRPLSMHVGPVRAEGHVISAGKKIAFAEGTLMGPDGKKYAHATTTCAIFAGVA